MKPTIRWAVEVSECGPLLYVKKALAEVMAKIYGRPVVEVTILPTADLERLVRAARTIASEIDTPVTAHSSEAIAELDNALAPFTGDADAVATD